MGNDITPKITVNNLISEEIFIIKMRKINIIMNRLMKSQFIHISFKFILL